MTWVAEQRGETLKNSCFHSLLVDLYLSVIVLGRFSCLSKTWLNWWLLPFRHSRVLPTLTLRFLNIVAGVWKSLWRHWHRNMIFRTLPCTNPKNMGPWLLFEQRTLKLKLAFWRKLKGSLTISGMFCSWIECSDLLIQHQMIISANRHRKGSTVWCQNIGCAFKYAASRHTGSSGRNVTTSVHICYGATASLLG